MAGTQQQCSIVRCSFCDKNQEQIERLIAGPHAVYICDQCEALCQEIIEEGRKHQSMCVRPPEQTATNQKPSGHQLSAPVPDR